MTSSPPSILRHTASGYKYRVFERLGSGAFGSVHRGVRTPLGGGREREGDDERDGETVAVKVVTVGSAADERRAEEEISLLRRVSGHPRILRLLDAFYHRLSPSLSLLCLVTPFHPAGSLLAVSHTPSLSPNLSPSPSLPQWVFFVRKRVSEVLDGVSYLHSLHCFHKDLKADNVLLSRSGNAVVADLGFGRSNAPGASYVRTRRVCPFYTPPGHVEAVERSGEVQWRVRDDVYQVGLLVLELVCRRLPPDVDTTRPVCSDTAKLEWWRTEAKRLCEAAGCLELWCGAERMLEYADEVTAEEVRRIVDGGEAAVDRAAYDQVVKRMAELSRELQDLRTSTPAASLSLSLSPRDSRTSHALCEAAAFGRYGECQRLLTAGADPECQSPTRGGETPLHLAVRFDHLGVCHLLLAALRRSGRTPDTRSDAGLTALHVAVLERRSNALRALLDAPGVGVSVPGPGGRTALAMAVSAGDVETARVLLDAGAEVAECEGRRSRRPVAPEMAKLLDAYRSEHVLVKT